jgi:hypothetical protein
MRSLPAVRRRSRSSTYAMWSAGAGLLSFLLLNSTSYAHGVEADKVYIQEITGVNICPLFTSVQSTCSPDPNTSFFCWA